MGRWIGLALLLVAGLGSNGCRSLSKPRMFVKDALLFPHRDFHTQGHVFHLQFEFNYHEGIHRCDLLLGPNPTESDAVAQYENPDELFFLRTGWTYLSGRWPAIRTTRVSATVRGSEMIVQVEDPAVKDVHRVFLVSGTAEIRVPPLVGAPITWDDPDIFYEIDAVPNPVLKRFSNAADDPGGTLRNFVNTAHKMAQDFGF